MIWWKGIYHFEGHLSEALKCFSYATNILSQIIMHKFDEDLERELILWIWNLGKVGRGDHSQYYKVTFIKDIPGHALSCLK